MSGIWEEVNRIKSKNTHKGITELYDEQGKAGVIAKERKKVISRHIYD